MTPVTIHDLLSLDSPAVQKALEIPCGLCGAARGEVCRPFDKRFPLATLVHFSRATTHWERKGKAA